MPVTGTTTSNLVGDDVAFAIREYQRARLGQGVVGGAVKAGKPAEDPLSLMALDISIGAKSAAQKALQGLNDEKQHEPAEDPMTGFQALKKGHVDWTDKSIPNWCTGNEFNRLHSWYRNKLARFKTADVEVEKATAVLRNMIGSQGVDKDRRLRCLWDSGWRPDGWKPEWNRWLSDKEGPNAYREAKAKGISRPPRSTQRPGTDRKQCRMIRWIFDHYKSFGPFSQPTWNRHQQMWKPNFEYSARLNDETDIVLGNFITAEKPHLLGCLLNYTAEKHRVYPSLGKRNREPGCRLYHPFDKVDWANIDVVTHLAQQKVGKLRTGMNLFRGYKSLSFETFFNAQRTGGKPASRENLDSFRGRHFFFKSPASSSKTEWTGKRFANTSGFCLYISQGAGYDLASESIYKFEAEVLLATGTTCKIDRVEKDWNCGYKVYCHMEHGPGLQLNKAQIRELKRRGQEQTRKVDRYTQYRPIYKEIGPIEKYFPKKLVWEFYGTQKWERMSGEPLKLLTKRFPDGKDSKGIHQGFKVPYAVRPGISFMLYVGNQPSDSSKDKLIAYGKSANCHSKRVFNTGFYQVRDQITSGRGTHWVSPVRCTEAYGPPA